MGEIREVAKAHYANLSESKKQEVLNRFKKMDRDGDGDGTVNRKEYLDYITKEGFKLDVFDFLDKRGDGTLDFDEYITFDFVYNTRGYSCCGGCSVVLLGIYFTCVSCHDAGKTYDLCCKCYAGKGYNHVDDHTHFRDVHSLIQLRKSKPAAPSQAMMEELVKTARLYYNSSSEDIKGLAQNFFKSLDYDNDGKVSLHEFLAFMQMEGHAKMSNRHFFKELDNDGNGTLEFMEVMALYYIIKSGRPFCGGCDEFIPGMYFTCSKCFEIGNNTFSVCPNCFEDSVFVHKHDQFMDNYALLEAMRKQGITTHSSQNKVAKPNSSVTITELPTSSSNAIAPYKPQSKLQGLQIAFKVVDLAINAANTFCTIM